MSTKHYYAGFWIRTLANLIDSVIMFMVSGLINVGLGLNFSGASGTGSKAVFSFLFSLAAIFIYFSIFQALMNGTFGKKLLGLELVDSKRYSQISMGQAVGRYGMLSVSVICLGFGVIWAGLHPRKQGWHDNVAGTVVVKRKYLKDLKLEAGIFPVKKKACAQVKAA